ncbi:MAG: PPC domain-containing DNA-binding protein, partial [Promethearchaeota archaeon]
SKLSGVILMDSISLTVEELIVARFDIGDDILLSIKQVATEHAVTAGMFSLIGAVDSVKIGFYDPNKRRYITKSWTPGLLKSPALEILSCQGNIGQLKGEPIVHGHITMSGMRGEMMGGHLLEGCRINPTGELTLLKASGTLTRRMNESLKLALLSL